MKALISNKAAAQSEYKDSIIKRNKAYDDARNQLTISIDIAHNDFKTSIVNNKSFIRAYDKAHVIFNNERDNAYRTSLIALNACKEFMG